MANGTADGPPRLTQALERLRVAVDAAFTRASRELDLTVQQAELLCAAIVPTPVGVLAKALRCDRSNVSRLVDRASRRGLLERTVDDVDGRLSMVSLTPEGDRLARAFLGTLEGRLAPLLDGWTAEREARAVELLDEIADFLDAGRPTDSARVPVDRPSRHG